jgi:hypothetical protein
MPRFGVDGAEFIEDSSTAAMSDTTLDCKFQKAGVPRHIGTQGRRAQEQVYSLNTSVFEEIAAMLLELFPASKPLRRKA